MDSNHDIVPTLRMFDGLMMNKAADEIERLRALLAEKVAGQEAVKDAAPAQSTENDAAEQFENLDLQNHRYRNALRKIMARLTDLLDEDQFGNIESIVREVGVEPATIPANVMSALDRICTPLDESVLKGATAEADAHSMKLIRDYVLYTAPQPSLPAQSGEQDERAAISSVGCTVDGDEIAAIRKASELMCAMGYPSEASQITCFLARAARATSPQPEQTERALTDEQIIERCKAAGIRWIPPEPDDEEGSGFPGLFDMVTMSEMRALIAAQPASSLAEGDKQ